ncbi:DNA-binding response regulator, partial [Klebsiella pneumoniae]
AIPLTQGEYGLLLALLQKARRVLIREELLALTRNESTEVFDRTINVLILRLWRNIELKPHQPALLKTLCGRLYVFSAN